MGLPSEEDWPEDVPMARSCFSSAPPLSVESYIPEIDPKGKDLFLVSFCGPVGRKTQC